MCSYHHKVVLKLFCAVICLKLGIMLIIAGICTAFYKPEPLLGPGSRR